MSHAIAPPKAVSLDSQLVWLEKEQRHQRKRWSQLVEHGRMSPQKAEEEDATLNAIGASVTRLKRLCEAAGTTRTSELLALIERARQP